MVAPEIVDALNAVGFIGSWQIDFTTHKMRGNGRCGLLFGIPPIKALNGVDLDLLDHAYLPEDLAMVKRHRRNLVGAGGRYILHYKLRDNETEQLVPVQSMMQVTVDQFGLVREAQGVLFEEPQFTRRPANTGVTHEDALRPLVDAAKALDALGYSSLKTMLQVIFKEVAQDAIKQKLARQP